MALPSGGYPASRPRAVDGRSGVRTSVAADFARFEELQRRWTALAVFGGPLLLIAGLQLLFPANLAKIGPEPWLAVLGLVCLVPAGGILYGTLYTEACFAIMGSGVTLVVTAMLLATGFDPSWSATAVAFLVVGAVAVVGAVPMAVRYYRRSGSE